MQNDPDKNEDMDPVPFQKADRELVFRLFVEDNARDLPHLNVKIKLYYDSLISGLLRDAKDGDEMWICGSKISGGLVGHEGIGLVRDGQVLKYEKLRQH